MNSSIFQILFCDFLFLVSFLSLFQVMHGKSVKKQNIRLALIAMALMCFFPFITGDYYHYKDAYESISMFDKTRMEEVYIAIASFSPSYLVFRIIIWGGALLLLSFTFKLTQIDFGIALCLFITRNFISFSYARVSLCMAMLFCGLALVTKLWEKRYLPFVLGIVLIFVSYFFHKSSVFGIGIAMMSLLFVKQSKFNVILFLFLVPVFIYLLTSLIDVYMDLDFSENDAVFMDGQRYFGTGRGRYNSMMKSIFDVLLRIPFFINLIMYFIVVVSGRFNLMPISIRVFANAAAFIVFISLLFLVVPGIYNYVLYYRFLNFAMIPTVVFATYCYSNGIYPKLVKMIYYFSLFGMVLSLLYKLTVKVVV